MIERYNELKKMDGKTCYTLSHNKPARMNIDDRKITITYPTGRCLELPRSIVLEAIHTLQTKGILTAEEVLRKINGPQTDRLLAVLRELPDVTFTSSPRALYLKK